MDINSNKICEIMESFNFEQHIRTSSKSRRGLRTYQLSSGVNKELDQELSSFGAYITTNYTEEVAYENYPILLLFIKYKDQYILCKSSYIGLDLHSYPPRTGNYIAHSLIYSSKLPFDVVELYSKFGWKTGQDVIDEDEGNIPKGIDNINIDLDNNKIWFEYIQNLISNDIRKNMLEKAIEVILKRKEKLLIIDDREFLICWVMTLLQCFPLEYIFEYIQITSYTNSTILVDLCNVLCFESANREKAQKYNENAIILDYSQHRKYPVDSAYANALIHEMNSENSLFEFKRMVFSKIANKNDFNFTQFENHANVFTKILRINELSNTEFKSLIKSILREDDGYIDTVFRKIQELSIYEKLPLVWNQIIQHSNLSNEIQKYKRCYAYTNSPESDILWAEFEKDQLTSLSLNSIQELNEYINVSKGCTHGDKQYIYCAEAINIINNQTSIKSKRIQFSKFKNCSIIANQEQQKELDQIEKNLSIYIAMKVGSPSEKLNLYINHYNHINDENLIHEMSKLIRLKWSDIITYLNKSENNIIKKLYQLESTNLDLPNKDLVNLMLKNLDLKKSNKFKQLLQNLPANELEYLFENADNKSIKEVIIQLQPIYTLTELENQLLKAKGLELNEDLIHAFLNESMEVWELIGVLYGENNYTRFENISEIGLKYKDVILNYINESDEPIPEEYNELAKHLQKTENLKLYIANDVIKDNYNDLLAIGATVDIRKLASKYRTKLLTIEALAAIIKLSWEYYTWKELFEVISNDNKGNFHLLITKFLFLSKSNKLNSKLSFYNYRYIYFEYIVFLIVDEHKDMLYNILNNTEFGLSIEGREYILGRINCLICKDSSQNESLRYFIEQTKPGLIKKIFR